MQKFWLMKSEPSECSIDDVLAAPKQTIDWWGIRNYQARNFMRDEMQIGDGVLFYHSSCKEPGIVGIARIASKTYPDPYQFDPNSKYYDPKSTPEKPRWLSIDVQAFRKTRLISLDDLRAHAETAQMRVLQRGNRLSITPVTQAEYDFITTVLMR